jgi:hypothetical protein
MEKGVSLSRAAEQEHTTPGVVRKYMGERVESRGRRWVLSGEYLKGRALKVYIATEEGKRLVSIADATTRSEYASYWNTVKSALHGDPNATAELAKFDGKTFSDASDQEYPYITDRRLLIQLYDDGKLDLEGFYDEMAK